MSSTNLATLAFLGLGGMGLPMARNLLVAGYPLVVWNRSPEVIKKLTEGGALKAMHPGDIAEAQIVVTMLSDDEVTEEVMIGQGALDALSSGAVWINMATVSIEHTERMQAACASRAIRYVAAPVLGRVDVAAAGMLHILTAGDTALLDEVQPLFDVLGANTWRFGDRAEQAVAVKLGANFMLASAIEAMGESSALIKAYGVENRVFIDMLTSTLFAAPAYKNYGDMIAESRYQPAGFALKLGLKDMQLTQKAAERHCVPMGFAGILRDNYLDAIAHNQGDLDWSALATVSARRSGQKPW